jgi:phosphonate degradation associated HDIG domain protein
VQQKPDALSVMSPILEEILQALKQRGQARYGEEVTVLQHSLQSAWFAEQDSAPPELVVAALLHDYGHLLHESGEDAADQGVDTRHEELGANFLSQHFPNAVTGPIRFHVAAKRYLCATETEYLQQLSVASLQSLMLQGGPFTGVEAKRFRMNPYFESSLCLRHYDEQAKDPELSVPDLEHYLPLMEQCLVG